MKAAINSFHFFIEKYCTVTFRNIPYLSETHTLESCRRNDRMSGIGFRTSSQGLGRKVKVEMDPTDHKADDEVQYLLLSFGFSIITNK